MKKIIIFVIYSLVLCTIFAESVDIILGGLDIIKENVTLDDLPVVTIDKEKLYEYPWVPMEKAKSEMEQSMLKAMFSNKLPRGDESKSLDPKRISSCAVVEEWRNLKIADVGSFGENMVLSNNGLIILLSPQEYSSVSVLKELQDVLLVMCVQIPDDENVGMVIYISMLATMLDK